MNKIYQKSFSDGKNAGFTLIELLVVVLIIGILAAVAVPQYQKAVLKARFVHAMAAGDALYDASELYYMANGVWPTQLDELDISLPGNMKEGNIIEGEGYFCQLFNGQENTQGGTRSIVCSLKKEVRDVSYRRFLGYHIGKRYCYTLITSNEGNGLCKTLGSYAFQNDTHNFYEIK